MKKKIFKIVGIILLVFVILLVAAPFFLKGKIATIIKEKVNSSIAADFDFKDADLTLFTSFPNAKVTLNEISLVNQAPFVGDTLFASKEVALEMSIKELFKGAEEPMSITSLSIDDALVNIIVDIDGKANYDIAVDDGTEVATGTATEEESSSFSLSMESYALTNSRISYLDEATGMHLEMLDLNHSGAGDLSLVKSELDTKTSVLVSFEMDSTHYLDKNPVKLDALIGVDLATNTYSFLKNEALINQLPLVFDGFIKVNETNQELDVNFKTPSSDFKNFLAVIPEVYSKNIEDVKTTGNFSVEGRFNGIVDETHIPMFNIDLKSDNASFKYPDLPKSVSHVYIDTQIHNETGVTEDTYVDINRLSFMIDEDKFNMVAKIRDLMGNTRVSSHIDGKMNLGNIAQAYPVPADLNLEGLLEANIDAAFDMASIENEKYENTDVKGNLNLKNFVYNSEELKSPVKLTSTSVTFNPKTVTLNELNGATGQTDFSAKGTINNMLGFMFNDENVEGNFDLKSNTFSVDDFMVEETAEVAMETKSETPETTTATEQIKIPSFLDATINASAATVIYDNLKLKNVSGGLIIKDETATLKNMTSSIFDGKLSFNGEVSTKDATPTFAMKLGMDSFDISETFNSLQLFKVLAPIASAVQGKLNSDIAISGNLNDDFTPNLATISGDLLGEILGTEIDPSQTKVLSTLNSKLNFLDLDKLDLKGLKTALTFDNGEVTVKPFTVNYQDIAINVNGSHSFDQSMKYAAVIDVPSKYLGSEVTGLIAKIDDDSLEELTIPVTANIGGSFSSPTVSTDLTSGVKTLTSKLVEIQKQKLLNQGKEKATDLIGGLLSKNSSSTDTTETKTNNADAVKNALGGLLGNKTETTATEDSSATETEEATTTTETKKENVKEAAKSVLGGLFGKKKDTTN
ncbi:AsmA family protein [Cellulophaga baltica]|uniref:AsmA-like C-terminal region-containing protein n=1 Tax=Cellulophaga TaxID=104264 RepID=UPI001C06EF46|nr:MULTISPECIES: AsmA-like C-terminal region-containing protein [Cellulophaga]MBU2995167.1 AsmA family protein [Cellulophaga baltica]MDO6766562.1 AsmA-like C-terminal region-containing protein [Cellulophaga sp. 1_MG-2023]